MKELLFYVIILLANIIQGITGFAGTILAMPFSMMLVGYGVAKPVLNVLGLLSGIYVFAGNRTHVNWKEFRTIVCVMTIGILGGIGIKLLLKDQDIVLYQLLGLFVVFLALQGLYQMLLAKKKKKDTPSKIGSGALLVGAGIAHGIFVSGGPLLIGYLTKKIKEKEVFRATISTVWIVLNTIILISDIQSGLWNIPLVKTQLLSIPFLLAGMFVGGKLYRIMSQRFFMILTYLLLLISGITLLLK